MDGGIVAVIGVSIAVVAFVTAFVTVYFCQKRREKMLDEPAQKKAAISTV